MELLDKIIKVWQANGDLTRDPKADYSDPVYAALWKANIALSEAITICTVKLKSINKEGKVLGKTFKVKKEYKKALESISESIKSADVLMSKGASNVRHYNDTLFKLIREKYPELKGYDYTYNHETMEISVIGKK